MHDKTVIAGKACACNKPVQRTGKIDGIYYTGILKLGFRPCLAIPLIKKAIKDETG
jgi:hypothetical protein